MTRLLLACLLSLSFAAPSEALADEPAGRTTNLRPSLCTFPRNTAPIFSIRTLPLRGSSQPTSTTFTLFENGAWAAHAGGPNPKSAQGCLPGAQVTAIKTALSRATWKTTGHGVPCDAIATHATEYLVGNKVVLRRELCDAIGLDRATEKSLADVMAIVNPLIASAR